MSILLAGLTLWTFLWKLCQDILIPIKKIYDFKVYGLSFRDSHFNPQRYPKLVRIVTFIAGRSRPSRLTMTSSRCWITGCAICTSAVLLTTESIEALLTFFKEQCKNRYLKIYTKQISVCFEQSPIEVQLNWHDLQWLTTTVLSLLNSHLYEFAE